MGKRQRHWGSAAEIEKAIDASLRKRDKLRAQAQCALDAESLFEGCDEVSYRKAGEEADKLLGKIKRLENTRLKKLQNLLAAFNTQPLSEANGVEGLNCRGGGS